MKPALILSILFTAFCGVIALLEPIPARATSCTMEDEVNCMHLCDAATPPTCGLYSESCEGVVSPTCYCEYVCMISPHDSGNNIKHLAIVPHEDGGV